MERSSESLLQQGLAELGWEDASAFAPLLATLADLVAEWGRRVNLSGHRSAEDVTRHLVLDAAGLATRLPALPPGSRLLDLGSGAGFPGLPLAVLWPHVEVLMLESRQKRHHFQRAAVRAMKLPNARPILGRAETIEPSACGLVIAQAVARPAALAELALPWLEPRGWLAVPGSAAAADPGAVPGFGPGRVLEYRVPLGGRDRTLWLAQR